MLSCHGRGARSRSVSDCKLAANLQKYHLGMIRNIKLLGGGGGETGLSVKQMQRDTSETNATKIYS